MVRIFSRIRRWAAVSAVLALGSTPALALETAGTVFVNLDASTYVSGATSWANPGVYGDFDTVGAPVRTTIGNAPAVFFDGADDAFVGRDLAPDGLVGENPTRTIEAWVYNPTIAAEETIVSWGKRGGPDGSNIAFNYGSNGRYGAVGHWGGDTTDVGWVDNAFTDGSPVAGQWHHLVYTYDGERTRVYSDGELSNEEDTLGAWGGLNTHADTPIAVASQWEGDAVNLTGGLKGSLGIGRLRIHDEVLTDAQILSNYNLEKANFVVPPPQPPKPEAIPKGPIHRYSFSNPAAADAGGATLIDSVGAANGVVLGDGTSFTGTGLRLPGGSGDTAGYGDLPNGLISKLTDVTIETWATIEGVQSWGRLFDFGSNNPGGDDGELEGPGDTNGGNNEGSDYLALTASRGTEVNNHRLEMRNEDPAGGGVTTVDFSVTKELPAAGLYTVVYDSDGTPITGTPELRVYHNGELMASGSTSIRLSDINDVNNWLGRSNWTVDANFEGTFDEFRIYDYALTTNQVLGNAQAGPNTVNVGTGVACDFDGDSDCDATDIDALNAAIRTGSTEAKYDLDKNGTVNAADRDVWVVSLKKTWYGDVNLDGLFDSADFVSAFQVGEYEDAVANNSTWADGDWDGDTEFTSSDFILAFQGGGYEAGPRAAVAAAVPEPATFGFLSTVMLGLGALRRRRR